MFINIPALIILSSIEEKNIHSCWMTYSYQVFVCDISITFVLFIIGILILIYGFLDLLFFGWNDKTHNTGETN